MTDRETQARALEQIAEELETAAAHCRVASTHMIEGETPRYAAHCWAAYGHIQRARQALTDDSISFSHRAEPVITDETER